MPLASDDPSATEAEQRLDTLTKKQREVLNLLVEHKTSKEIALLLGISPHTVDQRINFSREKLGGSSRRELALIYRTLVKIYQQSVYEKSRIPVSAFRLDRSDTDDANGLLTKVSPERTIPDGSKFRHSLYASDRGTTEVRSDVTKTLAMAVLIMVGLSIAIAGGLSIFIELSAIFAG